MLECKRIDDTVVNSPRYPGYTAKVDVYSLGIVFFWILSGKPPFDSRLCDDDTEFANAVLNGEFTIPANT